MADTLLDKYSIIAEALIGAELMMFMEAPSEYTGRKVSEALEREVSYSFEDVKALAETLQEKSVENFDQIVTNPEVEKYIMRFVREVILKNIEDEEKKLKMAKLARIVGSRVIIGQTSTIKDDKSNKRFAMTAGRVHLGEFVRATLSGDINCFTPFCIFYKNYKCAKKKVIIDNDQCMSCRVSSHKHSLLDKELPVVEMAKEDEIEPKEKKIVPPKTAEVKDENNDESPDKELMDIKSEIWEQSANETIEESLNMEQATKTFFEKIKAKLGEQYKAQKLTADQHKKLLSELSDLMEEGVLSNDLESRINTPTEKKEDKPEEGKPKEEHKQEPQQQSSQKEQQKPTEQATDIDKDINNILGGE